MQKAYGKSQAELETLVEGFAWALAGHGIEDIRQAMRTYILTHSDIPAPADILKIIAEAKTLDGVRLPGVEQLLDYQRRGIALTPKQVKILEDSGRDVTPSAPLR